MPSYLVPSWAIRPRLLIGVEGSESSLAEPSQALLCGLGVPGSMGRPGQILVGAGDLVSSFE